MTYSETPQLQPIVPAYHLRILDDEQLEQFKSATLTILEEVGIHCPSEKALNIYAEHRAQVDFESQIVKLPPDVVMEAMSHAPRYYTMGARAPADDLNLDGTAMYCATDGTGTETIDFETRQRRASTKDDVGKMARVTDYLSSLGFYWPIQKFLLLILLYLHLRRSSSFHEPKSLFFLIFLLLLYFVQLYRVYYNLVKSHH